MDDDLEGTGGRNGPGVEECVILEIQPQDRIEVYASVSGYVAIRQTMCMGDDQVVCIRPSDIPELIKLLRAVIPEAKEARVFHLEQEESKRREKE